jgi:hypothetical protein
MKKLWTWFLTNWPVRLGLAVALSATQAWAQLPTPISTALSVDTNGAIIFPTSLTAFLNTNGIASLAALTNALGSTANVTFGLASGTYLNTANVTLSCATPNATIVYTLDGTTPSATNGTTYSGSIAITSTKTVKAYATSYYRPDSSVTQSSYTITAGTKVYYGRSTNTSLTGAQVEALSSATKVSGINGNYSFASGSGYYYFAWLQSFDSPAQTTGFVINGTPVTMADSSVSYNGTADNGWTYQTATSGGNTYKVFRSAYQLGGANTVVLSGANAVP